MSVAQQLYEGIELDGQGITGLITYMRTDFNPISPIVAMKEVRDFIQQNLAKVSCLKMPRNIKPAPVLHKKHMRLSARPPIITRT